MKHRILGLLGGWRRRSLIAGALAVVAAGLVAMSAMAVHNEAFELDGNIDDANPAGGPEVDWDNDIVGVGADGFSVAQPQASLPAGFSSATAGPDFTTTIKQGVEVGATADTTTFTTNSKDDLDISAEWRCVNANNVTDKGDLVNTYAVAYVNAANQLIPISARRRTTPAAPTTSASGSCRTPTWLAILLRHKEAAAHPLRAVTSTVTSLSCPSSPAAAIRRPSPLTCGTTQRTTTSISWGRRAGSVALPVATIGCAPSPTQWRPQPAVEDLGQGRQHARHHGRAAVLRGCDQNECLRAGPVHQHAADQHALVGGDGRDAVRLRTA